MAGEVGSETRDYIRTALTADPLLFSLVGQNIYSVVVPSSAGAPYILIGAANTEHEQRGCFTLHEVDLVITASTRGADSTKARAISSRIAAVLSATRRAELPSSSVLTALKVESTRVQLNETSNAWTSEQIVSAFAYSS